jgi:hypothetical protein
VDVQDDLNNARGRREIATRVSTGGWSDQFQGRNGKVVSKEGRKRGKEATIGRGREARCRTLLIGQIATGRRILLSRSAMRLENSKGGKN